MQTLLFDLGGVIVDYRGPERLASLSNGALSLHDAHVALSSSSTLHAFERGEISPEAFAESMVSEWRLDVEPQAFIEDFETWPERFLPGARQALEALGGRYSLACLSNINIPHWRQAEALGVAPLFERAFLSHELGRRKPEPAIYKAVVERLGVPAERIVFFDDVFENIAAAKACGMQAHHVETPDMLASILMDGF